MSTPALIIGNKNYSSWSLRPWLLLKVNGSAFEKIRVPLYQQGSKAAIQMHTPAGHAQALVDWITEARNETEVLAQFER